MRRLMTYIALAMASILMGATAQAQLFKRAEQFFHTAFGESPADSLSRLSDTLPADGNRRKDSLRMHEMSLQLQELKANEAVLQSELEKAHIRQSEEDSLRLAEQMRAVDSLRAITPGIHVLVDGDTLFTIYAGRGGYTALNRAEMVRDALTKISEDNSIGQDSVYMVDYGDYVDIMYGDRVIVSVTDMDALWLGTTRHELAESYLPVISAKIADMRGDTNFWRIVLRIILFILVIVAQYALFKVTNYLFRRLRRRIIRFKQQQLKPVIIRDYELLNTRRLLRILVFLSNILRYIVLLVQLMFTVPILFAIFPQTEALAQKIFQYILDPIKMVLKSIAAYIPNLFIIVIIWLCIKYLIKGLRYIAGEIETEKLKINGFYPDWAQPTFNIVRFLLYAFMIAMIYPYLPGSESGVFQGISVFVGLIISLGSSTVIGNIIAGLVITYMRPFKLGDRIKLNDTTGNVIEKTPFVTRLRTPKNEVVTIPNSFIMSSHTINYSESARQFGLIIHTTVTIGYDAPWQQVHQLLINAARITPGVMEHPKPFVLETELQDYYPCYQINAYIKDADDYARIMSDLHQNIQDTFNEAGVEIMSPHYFAHRDGNASTIPSGSAKD